MQTTEYIEKLELDLLEEKTIRKIIEAGLVETEKVLEAAMEDITDLKILLAKAFSDA